MIAWADRVVLLLALLGVAAAGYLGLFVAPTEQMMGDVYRIMFVHVPSAWVALLAFTITFFCSVAYLFSSKDALDALAEASAEIGVVFTALLLITGSIWGRPTWGVWWTWDPRLTTAAIMFFAFLGYLALRRFVDVAQRRATWSAVVAIVIYADIPLVWFSVKWWNTLHQVQSTSQSMAPQMRTALYASALAFLVLFGALLRVRYRLGRQRQRLDLAPPIDVLPPVGEEKIKS